MPTALLNAVVTAVTREADRIVSLELRPAEGASRFPPFTAGAHIDLHLGNGMVRSYSLCNAQDEVDRYVVAVLDDRSSRGGSRWVHANVRPGHTLAISSPRNHFALDEGAPRSVLVAGGIGVTPLLAMARRLKQLGRQTVLLYCARSRQEAAFVPQLEALVGDGFELRLHMDDEAGGPVDLRQRLEGLGGQAHYYCCGPAGMVCAFEAACEALGYAHTHVERFQAVAPRPSAAEAPFEVELARTGQVVAVGACESVLRALLREGVCVEYSCEEGICGACETRVLAGEIDHRDSILSAAEQAAGRMMVICVSRCKGERLVLDL